MVRVTGYNRDLEWDCDVEVVGDASEEEEEEEDGNDDNDVQEKKIRNHIRYSNV